jgi:hypothetical protein
LNQYSDNTDFGATPHGTTALSDGVTKASFFSQTNNPSNRGTRLDPNFFPRHELDEYSGTASESDVSGNTEEQEEELELPTQSALIDRGIRIGVSSDKIRTSANNDSTNKSRLKWQMIQQLNIPHSQHSGSSKLTIVSNIIYGSCVKLGIRIPSDIRISTRIGVPSFTDLRLRSYPHGECTT